MTTAAIYASQRDKIRARNKAWGRAHPEYIRAYSAAFRAAHPEYMRARYQLGRAFADAAQAGGCVDCGTKEQVVLQFDHVRGLKHKDVGQMLGGSLKKLLAEIDKCETRCANCHARVTAQRKQGTER